jgi:Papain-like cysteine protease AvrRpt2
MPAVIPLLLPLPPDDRLIRSIIVAQPLHLKGRYDPNAIAKLRLHLDDGRELPIVTQAGQWQLQWSQGWATIGAHWLQLQGFDRSGTPIDQEFFYFIVCADAVIAASPIRLRLLQDSWFKATPQDSTQLPAAKKVLLPAGQTLEVLRYGLSPSHIQVRLRDAIEPVGHWGYLDAVGVELRQGDRLYALPKIDLLERTIDAQLQVRRTTYLKAQLTDSSRLDPTQKHQLIQGQILPLTAYARCDDHWRVRLPTIDGLDRAWIAAADVQISAGETSLNPVAPDLTLEILQTTPLKLRPLSPALLPLTEKTSLAPGDVIDLLSYANVGDQQLKVTRRWSTTDRRSSADPLPWTTGYVDAAHVQLRCGAQVLYPGREALELNLPIGPRCGGDPDRDWPILNIPAIAAVLRYYGMAADETALLQWCFDHHGLGSQGDRHCLRALLQAHGCQVESRPDWTTTELRATLKQSVPILVYGHFTPARHLVVLIGYGTAGWRLDDPWGDATTGYRDRLGDRVDYPADYFTAMVGADGAIVADAIRWATPPIAGMAVT